MNQLILDTLALLNDVLQASVVIFGLGVALYNLRHVRRDRVVRAFSALVTFVAIVYLTELLNSRDTIALSGDSWLRLGWIGIAMVPAAQFHLSDALLVTTGDVSGRRRLLVRVFYLTGLVFLLLVSFTTLIVDKLINIQRIPHLQAGPLFAIFALYFWGVTFVSIYGVWKARQRCVTSTTRSRMQMIFLGFMAAPLGVFPYLLISRNPDLPTNIPFWLILIMGNLVVGVMFSLLTYYMAYFGAVSPDRVVRVRLFKFMARVPLSAMIVLLVYVLVNRTSSLLGLDVETALAVSVVATVMLVQWAIHSFKYPLERLLQLNDDPDVRRIQELGDRLLTTRDMHQFLESLLIATCELLRTPNAFVVAITPAGTRLEVTVGPFQDIFEGEDWQQLAAGDGENPLITLGGFIVWHNYWIYPLHNRRHNNLVGILGVQARAAQPDLTPSEQDSFDRLSRQAANALEDRVLQQEVFAAVEGLLPDIIAIQARRSAATYSSDPLLNASEEPTPIVNDPDFTGMVRDALTHYWGGPKLTESPLMGLQIVQEAMKKHDGNPTKAIRGILEQAIEQQRPEGERNMTTGEWILYNILELKFIQGRRVRDVARRLAMSESDLYRKQRVAIENVAETIALMEREATKNDEA